MQWNLFGFLRRRSRIRLRPAAQAHSPRWATVFADRPVTCGVFWMLVWLTAFLLLMIERGAAPRFALGQIAPATIVAAEDIVLAEHASAPAEALTPVVSPSRLSSILPAGSVLVERGAPIDARALEVLRAYQAQIRDRVPAQSRWFNLLGNALLLLLGLLVTVVLFRFVRTDVIGRNSLVLLVLLVALTSLGPVFWLLRTASSAYPWMMPFVDYLLPLTLAPLLASLLIGSFAAIGVGFWVSFTAALYADYHLNVLVFGFVMAAVVARINRTARTRAALFKIGLGAGLAGSACAVGFFVLAPLPLLVLLQQILAALVSGILSALLAMLLLPLFEMIFRITTDISLLELADMEHPLLKRLAFEAPGTYHHSLLVANLTQTAVLAVGGNALLARISAYFHDVGKLVKPGFFAENIQLGENPHDDLAPSMSTLVIISHVKEGINLALRYKLPRLIGDAIQQHHGSGLVHYFYHKANVQADEVRGEMKNSGAAVNEENFRYPGPKPRSREIAIMSIADAVEAASRSLEKITPGRIEDLVHDVVKSKLDDGQLDECDLTLAEINTVRRALVFALSNMLHSRISYPKNENNRGQSPVATETAS